MKTWRAIYDEIKPYYLSDEMIAKEAYRLWEEGGKIDGEKWCERNGMKWKDVYWMLAKMMLEVVCEFDAGSFAIIQNG